MFRYALKKSYEELVVSMECALNNAHDLELIEDVNYRLGTHLHWLLSTWERIEKGDTTHLGEEIKKLMSALRHAYNSVKHEVMLAKLAQRTGGLSFPITFPLVIPAMEFIWAPLPTSSSSRFVKQSQNYKEVLDGKEISEILELAMNTAINID